MQSHTPAHTLSNWISRWFAICRHSQKNVLPVRINLQPRALFRTTLSQEGRIICTRGRLWVTASGHSGDMILLAGDSISVPRISQVVIEALEPSAFEMKQGSRVERHSKPFVIPTWLPK